MSLLSRYVGKLYRSKINPKNIILILDVAVMYYGAWCLTSLSAKGVCRGMIADKDFESSMARIYEEIK